MSPPDRATPVSALFKNLLGAARLSWSGLLSRAAAGASRVASLSGRVVTFVSVIYTVSFPNAYRADGRDRGDRLARILKRLWRVGLALLQIDEGAHDCGIEGLRPR